MGARHSLIVCGDLVGAFHSAPNWRSPVMGGLCTRDGEHTATGHAAHHQRRHSTKPRLSDGTALLAEPARRKPGPVCPSPREAFLQNYLHRRERVCERPYAAQSQWKRAKRFRKRIRWRSAVRGPVIPNVNSWTKAEDRLLGTRRRDYVLLGRT